MKFEDVKIGMKVVPHSKTVWSGLEESNSWKIALDRKQNYLYVIAWDDDERCFVLSENFIDKEGGDFFNPEDFELYIDKNKIIEEEINKYFHHRTDEEHNKLKNFALSIIEKCL